MGGKKLLFGHIRTHLPLYLVAVLSIASANVVNSLFPHVLGLFSDTLEKDRLTAAAITRYSMMLLAIGIGYGVLFGCGQYVNHRLGRRFEYSTRQRLFRHFTKLNDRFYSQYGIGKLLSFCMNDVTAVRESIANGLNQLTNATVLLLSVIVMMSISHIPLYLVAVCVLPLLSIPFIVTHFGPRIRDRARGVQEALASMTESAEEQFGGIRVTKTFAVEDMARQRFDGTVEEIRSRQLLLVRLTSMFQSLLPFAGALSLAIAIIYGGALTIRHDLSIGNFVALTLYLRMLMGPLQQIGNVINTVHRARASLERLNNLLAEEPDIRESADARPMNPANPAIEIDHLTFYYDGYDHPSLYDINVRLPAGKTLGIVGRTGSGKTTLVKLLLRIMDPPAGSIRIGGRDIRELTLESLRTHIGYVPQDGFLFSTTIRDNIAFHDRHSALEQVESAARLADIYNNIVELPNSFDTKLGERGITLSGGQRQRTSLARGLIKDAPILIMDDSVSAVDAVTETHILDNVRKTREGKTTIIIAHRISAVKHADEIIVLEEGRIAERGTHEELLAKGGSYAALHAIQEEGTPHGETGSGD